jgi:hypothetical protein
MQSATILLDSIGVDAPRLTSMELVYPRAIHGEFMTHRAFGRNASSSRAIPVKRMIAAMRENPAFPAEWRMDEPGMQGWTKADAVGEEQAKRIFIAAMEDAIRHAEELNRLGFHKQHVNRLTEPYQHIRVVVTATDWDNFFGLRVHGDADPTMQALAVAMKEAMDASTPTLLQQGEWHLPYVTAEDDETIAAFIALNDPISLAEMGLPQEPGLLMMELRKRISIARCARVSYKTHDGAPTEVAKDLALAHRLVGAQPLHASPAEHQAAPDRWLTKGKRWMSPERHGNLTGWNQNRKFLANENLQQPITLAA